MWGFLPQQHARPNNHYFPYFPSSLPPLLLTILIRICPTRSFLSLLFFIFLVDAHHDPGPWHISSIVFGRFSFIWPSNTCRFLSFSSISALALDLHQALSSLVFLSFSGTTYASISPLAHEEWADT